MAIVNGVNYNDIEIYQNDIATYTAEYINALESKEDIYNTDVFNGLIDYIYIHCFKPDRRTIQNRVNNYNGIQNSRLDYSDIDTIADLWNIYKAICARCRKTYTQLQFCSMIGLSKDAFNDWLNGVNRANTGHSQMAKKINADCEAATLGKVLNSSSVPAMFVLKAGFGWQENQQITINTGIESHDSAEQIAARHASAQLPEMPNFSEE